jgi:hypothetical protein
MKPFSIVVLLAVAVICRAKEPAPDASQSAPLAMVRVEWQVVAVPEALAVPIVRAFDQPQTNAAAYDKLQKLLEKGSAKLLGWPIITTQSGNRAITESVREFRFPTGFDSGAVEVFVDEKDGKFTDITSNRSALEVPVTPVEYETRNLGMTLEVEPAISPDFKSVEMQFSLQHVRLVSVRKVTVETEKKLKVIVEQPDIECFKVTTNLAVTDGQHSLVGVFKSTELPGSLELFVLTTGIRKPLSK